MNKNKLPTMWYEGQQINNDNKVLYLLYIAKYLLFCAIINKIKLINSL